MLVWVIIMFHNCNEKTPAYWYSELVPLEPFQFDKTPTFVTILNNISLFAFQDWSEICYNEFVTSSSLLEFGKEYVHVIKFYQLVMHYFSFQLYIDSLNLKFDETILGSQSASFSSIHILSTKQFISTLNVDLTNISQCNEVSQYYYKILQTDYDSYHNKANPLA